MQPTDDADQAAFRTRVRAWIAEHAPAATEADEPGRMRQWRDDLIAGGFYGIGWPAEYGGAQLTDDEQAVLNEELTLANAPRMRGGMGMMWVGPAVLAFGTPEQQATYLKPILTGEHEWCTGYSEPGSGSDLASITTRAIVDGDDYVVNGQKVWTTVAHQSTHCFLLCRTSNEGAKHKGLSVLLVDMAAPGVEVRPLRQITGDSEFNELFFTDLRVPVRDRLGDEGQGWEIVRSALVNERAGLSQAISVDRELAQLVAFAKERGRTTGTDRDRLARLFTEARVMAWSTMRIDSDFRQGRLDPGLAAANKLLMSTLAQKMSDFVVDMMGADGMLFDRPDKAVDVERADPVYRFLYTRCLTIAGGTSEIQRNVIGERVLGLPR